jgi:SAM-dependent methyltransferase
MNEIQEFWNNRYKENSTGWDLGQVSPPIKEYFDQVTDKNLKIIIPGCGNAHEAEYLHKKGFKNVFLVDIAPLALENFSKRVPDFPKDHLINADFFKHYGQYDIMVEQTFFCAINPTLRKDYAEHAAKILKPGGKLIGLLFDDELTANHPPYGGCKEEYLTYFKPYFEIKTMETAYNSIKPRANRELFINLVKK